MNGQIDFSKVIPSAQMNGEDKDQTLELSAMHQEASDYLLSFGWCKAVRESYCGLAIPGVVGVFLFKIYPARQRVDEWLWVVVGDISRTHIVVAEDELWLGSVVGLSSLVVSIPGNGPGTTAHG